MPTFECSQCGSRAVERDYYVMAVDVKCPAEDCGEFCPHVNLDHHTIQDLIATNDLEPSASALVDLLRG